MAEVTLNQILDSREERVKRQHNILSRFNRPIISFTMNIAGPIKTSPIVERAFCEGIRILEEALNNHGIGIAYRDTFVKATGCEAIFSVNSDASKIKSICTDIEDTVSMGRIFDMDVIDTDGNKLERKNVRNCLICGAPGRNCAASRAHSVEKLQSATRQIIENYFFSHDKEYCSTLAVKSLLDEVNTTPKPGLVDRRNNGSHNDMDIHLFKKSAFSLMPYFDKCFSIGRETAKLTYDETFSSMRNTGILAEKTMYDATGGINTHKGIIYSLGILCASIGRLWSPEIGFPNSSDICREGANIVRNAIKKDFEQIDSSTAGGRGYLKYGLTGIRGEVSSGYKSVLKFGLPCYKNLINKGIEKNDAGSVTLLHLIANVDDTNLYHRGGIEGARYAANAAKNLLSDSQVPTKEEIELLDDDFIRRNLSPGGCADLLAITYFLYNFEE